MAVFLPRLRQKLAAVVCRNQCLAIMLGFAGKTPLPDQLLSGEIRKINFWPDLPNFEVCTFWIT
jgi:hypothetical protein